MAKVAECGTDSGYYRHRRRTKTPPCEACLAAHAAAARARNWGEPVPARKCWCGRTIKTRRFNECSWCRRIVRTPPPEPKVEWTRRGSIMVAVRVSGDVPMPPPPKPAIDENVILRRLAGDKTVRATAEEAREVIRRLRDQGWSYDRIQEHTGLNTWRVWGSTKKPRVPSNA